MKQYMTKFLVLLMIVMGISLVALAQNEGSVTFTEAEINATYRVTNPRRASMTNVSVDLKPDTVFIYATYTPRGGESVDAVVQLTPTITVNGTIEWTLVDLSRTDGGVLTDAAETAIESLIGRSWESYWAGRTYRLDLTAITVTENDLTYGYVWTGESAPVQPTVTVEEGTAQVAYTESEINELYHVTTPRRATISDVYVDLQPGQVVISATYAPRRGDTLDTVTTLMPEVDEGVLTWQVVSVVVNGEYLEDTTTINDIIANSWATYWKQRFTREHLTGVVITDDTITFTYE